MVDLRFNPPYQGGRFFFYCLELKIFPRKSQVTKSKWQVYLYLLMETQAENIKLNLRGGLKRHFCNVFIFSLYVCVLSRLLHLLVRVSFNVTAGPVSPLGYWHCISGIDKKIAFILEKIQKDRQHNIWQVFPNFIGQNMKRIISELCKVQNNSNLLINLGILNILLGN